MARPRTIFRCTACDQSAPQWVGRCPACRAWSTLEEEREPGRSVAALELGTPVPARPITEGDAGDGVVVPTGLDELDRVLGGGLVPGSVSLLGGEPGMGKSTLLLQVAGAAAAAGRRVLYVTAEEGRAQVRQRAERLAALHEGLWLAAETFIPHILGHVAEIEPDLLIVDSIQAVSDPEVGSAAGTVTQVRAAAQQLVAEAKRRDLATVLVGHVTKDGALAGPRVLEHVVDTVLAFEGDRHHALRLLRAVKHRYGATSDLGLFEMADDGLRSVPDPSRLFLADRRAGVPGSVVVPTLEGHRPLLVELQALVVRSPLAQPRRSAQGVDGGRLSLLLAVLDQRAGFSLAGHDVYALAVGGVRVIEPGADLALALAVASAAGDTPLDQDLAACGEIGLGGEVRQAAQSGRRLAEAARLGFRRVVVARSAPEPPPGLEAIRVDTLAQAVAAVGLSTTVPARS